MNDLLKLTIKLAFLAIMLVGLNLIYSQYFSEQDIQQHAPVVNLIRSAVSNESEILYLGESSNLAFRDSDGDKRSMSDFISDHFPNLKLGNITKEASHAGIYHELLQQIPEESSVKTVIVTMNLRSFNADWIHSELETPLQKSMVLLNHYPPLANRFVLAFKGYDIKSNEEREAQVVEARESQYLQLDGMNRFTNVAQWDKAMEAQGIWNADGSDNKELTSLACHYIKTYAFRINALENPRIKDFDHIVALAKKRNWNLVFNLLAENMQQANTLVGKDLIDIMRSNRDLLMNRYNKSGVVVVDNLEAVPDNQFIDRNWTTEHYAEVGRKIIAKRVAIQLKDLHADQYVNMEYVTAKSATFFNDCEGKQKWNQMSTITSDRAASGTMSSKSGAGNDYSLTFEHPINLVSDSMQVLNVEMKIFQESLDHDAKLTFVCSGQGKENHLVEIPISNFEKAPKDWQTINYSMKLPSDFYNREIVKVFIYNPSKSLIYLDDFRLTFGQ